MWCPLASREGWVRAVEGRKARLGRVERQAVCIASSIAGVASKSLQEWQSNASAAFNEIENAHRAVGGTKPGRRFLTQQINYAYVTLLAARFQGFARALHSQTADTIAAGTHSIDYRVMLRESLTHNRALDKHNAQPNSIAEDFDRFGINIWRDVDTARAGNEERRKKLWALITWRNAIAHQDIDEKLARDVLDPVKITLDTCRGWRSALNLLAISLDRVAADRCETLGLPRPW
jgi:hypothetical protein